MSNYKQGTKKNHKGLYDSPFLPCCFNVFAERWMELPCPPVCGNLRSGKLPSVLILATSSSANIEQAQARKLRGCVLFAAIGMPLLKHESKESVKKYDRQRVQQLQHWQSQGVGPMGHWPQLKFD